MGDQTRMLEAARRNFVQWVARSAWADQLGILAIVLLARVWSFGRSTINIDESFYMLIAREILAGRNNCQGRNST